MMGMHLQSQMELLTQTLATLNRLEDDLVGDFKFALDYRLDYRTRRNDLIIETIDQSR